MSIVLDVSDANYKEFTDSAGAVVAYGLATCEPCKAYDPILEATAAKFPNMVHGSRNASTSGTALVPAMYSGVAIERGTNPLR